MTTPPMSIVVKDLLVDAGIGVFGVPATVDLWPIFIGSEPDDLNGLDNCLTIYDRGGEPPNPKFLLDFPRFQIRVRSNSYEDGWNKASEARELLLGLPSQTIGVVRYDGVYVTIDTRMLMADTKGRPIFVTDYRVIREPATGTNRVSL